MKRFTIICMVSLLLAGCATQQRGYNYKAHKKKGKTGKVYKGDLTKYNCRKK